MGLREESRLQSQNAGEESGNLAVQERSICCRGKDSRKREGGVVEVGAEEGAQLRKVGWEGMICRRRF